MLILPLEPNTMFVEDKLEYDIMFQNKYLTIAPQLNYSQEDLRRSDFE